MFLLGIGENKYFCIVLKKLCSVTHDITTVKKTITILSLLIFSILSYAQITVPAQGLKITSGNNLPNGQVFGSAGDLFMSKVGNSGTLWQKVSGANTKTGWEQISLPSLNGVPSGYVLTDSSGKAVWQASGGGSSLEAGNGITISGDSIHLGGELFQNSLIKPNGNILAIGDGANRNFVIDTYVVSISQQLLNVESENFIITGSALGWQLASENIECDGSSFKKYNSTSTIVYGGQHTEQYRSPDALREYGLADSASSIRSFDTLPDGQLLEYGLFNYIRGNGSRATNIYVGKTPHPDSTFRDIGNFEVLWDTSGHTRLTMQLATDTNGFTGQANRHAIEFSQTEGIRIMTNNKSGISPEDGLIWNQHDTGINYKLNGNHRFAIDTFGIVTPGKMDSVSIYAITPQGGEGSQVFCTNCTGNGITGRLLTWIGAAWRRLLFE